MAQPEGVLYSHGMAQMNSVDHLAPEHRARLGPKLSRWRAWLHNTGLDGLTSALLTAGAPLGVVGASLLWMAQPALNLFASAEGRQGITDLARTLSEPGGVAWLADQLAISDAAETPDTPGVPDVQTRGQ